MISKYTNKNGVKLLSALAVIALALTAVVITVDQTDGAVEPTVTVNFEEEYFVVGEDGFFSVTTTKGDYTGANVVGTGTFEGSEGMTIWYDADGDKETSDWIEWTSGDFGPSAGFALSDATSYFKVNLTKAGTFSLNIIMQTVDKKETVCETTATVQVLANDAVAKIGDAYYATLDDAIKAVSDKGTIELIDDASIGYIFESSKTFTIDGGTPAASGEKTKLTITSSADTFRGTFTLKNLEIVAGDGSMGYLMVAGGCTSNNMITFENVTTKYNVHVNDGVKLVKFIGCKLEGLLQFVVADKSNEFVIEDSSIGELNLNPTGVETVTIDSTSGMVKIDDKSTMDRLSVVVKSATITNSALNVNKLDIFDGGKYGIGKIIIGEEVALSAVNGNIVTIEQGLTVQISSGSMFANSLYLNGKLIMGAGSTFVGTLQNVTDNVTNSITSSKGIKAGDNGLTISKGSIVMNGEALVEDENDTIIITGNATLDGNTTVQNLVIASDATLTIPGDYSLTITGDSVNDGKLINNGTVTNDGNFTNNNLIQTTSGEFSNTGTIIQAPTASTTGDIDGNQPQSSTSTSEDSLGLKNYLENDFTVSKKAFLAGDLTVREGVTLTITSTGSLDLNGHKLILEGNLVIATGGSISALNDGTDTSDVISIMKTGSITSTGIIGKGIHTVSVSMGETTSYLGQGVVSMKNVNGVSFGTKKVVDENVTYILTVSGSVVKDGVGDAELVIEDAIIASDMTIGSDVNFNGVDAEIAKNAMLIVNGTAGGNVFINIGAIVELNGKTADTGFSVEAYSGTFTAPDKPTDSNVVSIDVIDTKGIKIYADSKTYMDEEDQKTDYMIHISGAPVYTGTSGDGTASIEFTDFVTGNQYIIIDDALVFGTDYAKEFDFSTDKTFDLPIVVDGKVTLPDGYTFSDYIGTSYAIETEVNGVKVKTNYISTFDEAYGQLSSVYQNTITVKGELEIDSAYTIASKQTIKIDVESISITANGSITVQAEGKIEGVIYDVEGTLTVLYGASVKEPANYDVKAIADNGDVTYSGIAIAINNAKPGQTVTIVQAANVSGSLTIPEGVKVVVSETGSLTVEKNLTVKGELIAQNGVTIGKDVAVSGKLDCTDGTLTVETESKITSTGEIIVTGTQFDDINEKVNGATYTNDDGYTVITTVEKAVNESSKMDIPVKVCVYGKVSESTPIVADNVEMEIHGEEVVLSDVTVNGKTLTILDDAVFTGTVKGTAGNDGATTVTAITLNKVSDLVITNASSTGTDGVTVWYTSVITNDDNDKLVGQVTINEGTATVGDDMIVANADNVPSKITVSEGATLVVPADVELTSTKGVSVNGILSVIGTFDADDASVAGNIIIEKDGTVEAGKLTVTGTVTVKSDEDDSGTFKVDGNLILGKAPETLGAGASILGKITVSGNNYIIAYPGSDLSNAVINNGEAVSTEVIINGYTYATLYADKNNSMKIFGTGGVFTSTIKITGLQGISVDDTKWKSDEAMTKSITNTIGKNAKVYYIAEPSEIPLVASATVGLEIYIDGLSLDNFQNKISVGTHTVTLGVQSGYDGSKAIITFNGMTVGADGKITVTADMDKVTILASGATPAVTPTPAPTPIQPSEKDDSMGITEYLLIVLVVLAAILVVVVAIRMMRS